MTPIERQWLRLRWPHEVKADHIEAALRGLNGLSTRRRRESITIQAIGTNNGVAHYLVVPAARQEAVTHSLRQAIPGLVIEPVEPPTEAWKSQWVVWMSTRRRPLLSAEAETLSRGLISALGGVYGNEALALTWVLGPVRRPIAVPNKAHSGHADSWQAYIPIGLTELDNDARTALIKKQGEPGWRAAGRIAVRAASKDRQYQLLHRVSGALRAAQGSGVQIGAHRALLASPSQLPWRRPLALNVHELSGVAAWPMGELESLAIERVGSRVLPVPRGVASTGRVIGVHGAPADGRSVAITPVDSLSHAWITGPTGSGKSELVARLCAQDIEAGRAVVVIDPKGDLVTALLTQIPQHRRDDVVVIDPTDDTPVGLNVFSRSRRNPEVVADQMLHLFRRLSGEAWGPRVGDVLAASLLTLAQQPDSNLCALPILLSDARYRAKVLERLDDPFGLSPFWAAFSALGESERQQTIAPVTRRVRQLVMQPQMRAVLGQTRPKFDLTQVFTERKIVLVSLAKGLVGPNASSLLGSLVLSQLWQTILGRAAVTPEQRHPVMVFIDEVQDYVHGLTDVGEMFAQARGLGVGLTVAHQATSQLSTELKGALSANARSRVIFQTSTDDAGYFARGQSVLRPEDFQRLPRYEAYASLLASGHVTPFMSVRTLPLGPSISEPDELRFLSRQHFGRPRVEVEAELRELLLPKADTNEQIGVRRRTP